jgi:hypothetical protein
MAALLVALAVMSVLMSAALPAWRHHAKREKEEELIFRGEQYARAIGLWERKNGPGTRPANLDMLVSQRFLRKRYKDPMTEDGEFQPIFMGVNPALPGGRGGAQAPGGRGAAPAAGRGAQGPTPPVAALPGGAVAGVQGVVSRSQAKSIKQYRGRSQYNEWLFVHAGAANAPGGRGVQAPGGVGQPMPGGRGRGVGPGGRGQPGRGFGPGRGGFGTPRGGGPGGRGRGQ